MDECKKLIDARAVAKKEYDRVKSGMDAKTRGIVAGNPCTSTPKPMKAMMRSWAKLTALPLIAMSGEVPYKTGDTSLCLRQLNGEIINLREDDAHSNIRALGSASVQEDSKADSKSDTKSDTTLSTVVELEGRVSTETIDKDMAKQLPAIQKSLFGGKPIQLKPSRITAVFKDGVYVPSDKDTLLVSLGTDSEGGQIQVPDNVRAIYGDLDDPEGCEDGDDELKTLFKMDRTMLAYRGPLEGKFTPVTSGFRIIVTYDIVPVEPATDVAGDSKESGKDSTKEAGKEAPKKSKKPIKKDFSSYVTWLNICKLDETKVTEEQKTAIIALADQIVQHLEKRKSIAFLLKHTYPTHDPATLMDVDRALYDRLVTLQHEAKVGSAQVDSVIVTDRGDVAHPTAHWKNQLTFVPASGYCEGADYRASSAIIIRPIPAKPKAEDEPSAKRQRGATHS